MDSRTEARVNDWDSRPLSDGFEDLRGLADDEFSGAVAADGATLFMLNGRVVGIVDGDMSTFEDASGTIHEAPHPSLPLLFAMREQGGEERAKYYTNDTPISEADETLSSGTFTGYVELSENVLSGDYYVVYYGGRSMSCAFVGNAERLVTGDEAFERADDEVGIYTVYDVEIEVTDIPEADDGADAAAGGATAAGAGAAGASGDADAAGAADPTGDGVGAGDADAGGADPAGVADATRAERGGRADGTAGAARADDHAGTGGDAGSAPDDAVAAPPVDEGRGGRRTDADAERPPERDPDDGGGEDAGRTGRPGAGAGTEPSAAVEGSEPDAGSGRRATDGEAGRRARDTGSQPRDPTQRRADDEATTADTGGAMAEVPDEVMAEVEDEAESEFDEEVAWRETTTIPSINPERTTDEDPDPLASASGSAANADAGSSGPGGESGARTADPGDADARNRGGRSNAASSAAERARTDGTTGSGDAGAPGGRTADTPGARNGASGAGGAAGSGGVDPDRVEALEAELEDVREERDAVAAERDDLARERDDLRERNRELEARVDELESEVSELEAELADAREQLDAADGGAAEASVELAPREALEGTNLFVRYGSKSGTTMEDVHDRGVSVADLESNLRLEYHTGFDAADAVVDGRPYDEFLYESTPYRFVEWFVYDLVFEVRDTGNESELADLYEAFPKIDRIELYGDVSLRYDENGEEHREQTTFDVVVRDRMGNPLAVANVNDGREPATEDMMVDLQERAARVKRTSDALAGAFMVTASYFEPGALETADEATSGSLLSRDSKKSYVKLSRKRGYHLCLVETRNGEFHVNVPEL